MTSQAQVDSVRRLMEVLSAKVGAVAIVVGVVHFANVWAFNAFRRRALLRAKSLPPLEPNGFTPVRVGTVQGPWGSGSAGSDAPWVTPWGAPTPTAGSEL